MESPGLVAYYKPKGGEIPKPRQIDKIVELSEKLAEGIPQVRVDWYIVDEKIYFGETTFYTWSGFIKYEPKEWDLKMGEWLVLPFEEKKV